METALSLALLAVSGEDEPADRRDLAKLCSRVENDWVGAETGLLDQLASLCSEPGHAVRIDFASLAIEPVPLELGGWTLVTQNSGATHSIAYSGYNDRRRECREACAQLGIDSLSEAAEADLDGLPDTLRRRTRHVLTENAPRRRDGGALRADDLEQAGRLLDASHASLRDDYEASVPEVERTVERAQGRRRGRRADDRRRLRRRGARATAARRRRPRRGAPRRSRAPRRARLTRAPRSAAATAPRR